MAEDKKSYPMLPIQHWWALRKKFKQSIPGVVTDNYLATVLNMQISSARNNVLPYLKQMGIIDEDGKTGDVAKRWRDDTQYKEVCEEILTRVYPQELLHAVDAPSEDRSEAQRWFANQTGTGEVAANKMARLYILLLEADLAKQPDGNKATPKPATERKPRRNRAATTERKGDPPPPPPRGSDDSRPPAKPSAPEININLQVHISADATPDQIEQIFASMSKHIYQRG